MVVSVDHPFFQGLSPTLHIAHRGGARLAPENTMVAFRQALELHRTDVVELDVQLSRDGVLVVSHDEVLDRCTDGVGPLAARTWPELAPLDAAFRFSLDGGRTFPLRGEGVGIPRLVDVLAAFPHARFNIELKLPLGDAAGGAESIFARALRDAAVLDRVCIGSEHDAVAARLHQELPEACFFYPRDALIALVVSLKSGAAPASDRRFQVLDMPLHYDGVRLIDEDFLARTRALGAWVNVWTIDDEAEMRRLVAEGVGGIMTDRPDVLRAVLG